MLFSLFLAIFLYIAFLYYKYNITKLYLKYILLLYIFLILSLKINNIIVFFKLYY